MPGEGFDFFKSGGIPQFHCLVTTCRCQDFAIRAEARAINWMKFKLD
jgi:hypothetical protein